MVREDKKKNECNFATETRRHKGSQKNKDIICASWRLGVFVAVFYEAF